MLRVNNLSGFGGGFVPNITLVDDGDSATSAGAGTATHTYSSEASTGPHSILCVTAEEGNHAFTLNTVTWGGVAMTQLVTARTTSGTQDQLAAIYYIAGAQSGNIVLSFSATVNDSFITKLSLANLRSSSPTDTDTATSNSANSLTLSALNAAPAGGIRIAVFSEGDAATAITWTWAGSTEASDVNVGAYRHSVSYFIDDTAGGNITAASAGLDLCALVGVTLR